MVIVRSMLIGVMINNAYLSVTDMMTTEEKKGM
jgi:hypothetical protein